MKQFSKSDLEHKISKLTNSFETESLEFLKQLSINALEELSHNISPKKSKIFSMVHEVLKEKSS